MPRSHNLHTNEELLDTFNQNGRDIFVRTYERQFERGLPDAVKGKKLARLSLSFSQRLPTESLPKKHPVNKMILDIRPTSIDQALFVQDEHSRWRERKDIGNTMEAEARYFDDTLLDDYFQPKTLGKYALKTDFTAVVAGTHDIRRVGTLEEALDTRNLLSGLAFEDDAFTYLNSPDFALDYFARIARADGAAYSPYDLRHSVTLSMHAGDTVNGCETTQYRQEWLDIFIQKHRKILKNIEELTKLQAPPAMIDNQREHLQNIEVSIASLNSTLT